jgi:hypothetical protein
MTRVNPHQPWSQWALKRRTFNKAILAFFSACWSGWSQNGEQETS